MIPAKQNSIDYEFAEMLAADFQLSSIVENRF